MITPNSQDFASGGVEYRAIKIYGTKATMDHWAEKFLMMKPVRPPKSELFIGKEGREKNTRNTGGQRSRVE